MKRFFGLFLLVLFVNSCDDGDLILETIDFDDVDTQSCSNSNILYKLNDKEALLLEIDKSIFQNEPTPVGKPIEISIGSSNRVFYRFYDGIVESDNICETIPPATPYVIDQWTAKEGGIIQIFTTATKTTNATTNATRITGYNHNIVFKNITFLKKNGGNQVYESFSFGNFTNPITPLAFNFNSPIEKCNTNNPNLIFTFNGSEALTLLIDPVLLTNEVTQLNEPRTGVLNSSTNILTYRRYSGLLNINYFCNVTTPSTPVLEQEWNAVSGVSNESGIIEVNTTTSGSGFKHTIVIKKVTLQKGTNDFYLGDSYTLGEILTN